MYLVRQSINSLFTDCQTNYSALQASFTVKIAFLQKYYAFLQMKPESMASKSTLIIHPNIVHFLHTRTCKGYS
jgi:hypothetical protein